MRMEIKLAAVALAASLAMASFATFNHAEAQSVGCVATSAAPTWVNNTSHSLSCDLSGNLRGSGGGGGGGTSSNFSAAFPTAGTAAGAKDSTGLLMVPFNVDASGNLKVNVAAGGASGGTSSTFGATFPATGTAVGFTDGTNMQAAKVDGSQSVNIDQQTLVGTTVAVGNGVTNAGTQRFTLSSDSTGQVNAVQSGTWNVGTVTAVTTVTNPVTVAQTTAGNLHMQASGNAAAGSAINGNPVLIAGSDGVNVQNVFAYSGTSALVDGASNTPGAGVLSVGNMRGLLFNTATWDRQRSGGVTGMAGVNPQATPSGGETSFHLIAANSNNSTLISTGVHTVYDLQLTNNSATIAYAKLYDKATAPTCGTDVPVATLIIPASTSGAGSNVEFGAAGKLISLGLGLCVVTGIADTDNTSAGATTYAINIDYK